MGDRPVYGRSARSVVRSTNGMIATSQPLASAAGLEILMKGGTAVDAIVAASAVLGVVEPFSTSIGGDSFAMYWDGKKGELIGLNGSGRSAASANAEELKSREGFTVMPETGVHTVTVPGAVDAWAALLERYGTMELKELLQPAIRYAQEGFPVSEIIAYSWHMNRRYLETPEAQRVFLIDGNAPEAGRIFKNPDYADSLELIANKGPDVFYKGELAEAICNCIKRLGGQLSLQDFANHTSEWVRPITTNYKGYDIYELPPNGQGAMVLEMLNILEGYDMKALGHNTADYLHLIIEAKKAAFADRAKFVADPAFNDLPTERIISKEYASQKRQTLRSSDTVYLTAADRYGNIISFISSIFGDFASGIVPEGTGIILQNRGALFSLEKGHFNCLEPSKRPLHTIIPAFVLKDGKPWLSFGVMGGDMQPQGHVQVLLNMIEFGMNVQEAGEAPRVCHCADGVALEQGIPWNERLKLIEKGHSIITGFDIFGGYQGIHINPKNGAFEGGSDDRKDGCAIGY